MYYIIPIFLINLITFLAMGLDKYYAIRNYRRISEKSLLLLATCGGSIGSILGMKLFRHKTKHAIFKYGIPLLLILHTIVLILLLSHT